MTGFEDSSTVFTVLMSCTQAHSKIGSLCFPSRLTRVLNEFGEGDWHLATLVCQALWNYCTESTNLHAALGIDQTNHLLAILVDLLGEMSVQESLLPSSITDTRPVTGITRIFLPSLLKPS